MKIGFFSKLSRRIDEIDSLLCVGIDPHAEDVAKLDAGQLRNFGLNLIEATSRSAAAYKPNAAFFEAAGTAGVEALREIINAVPDGIPVILDVKRGDIGSTAAAYAAAAFDFYGVDAVTLNPYLGSDSIEPFSSRSEKGAFVLCKTSNHGAEEFQDLLLADHQTKLYLQIADQVARWSEFENLGLVIGATQVESIQAVRRRQPEIWILAPGVGAQGGNLREAARAGIRIDGKGMLFPVSRGISRAENPGSAAELLRVEINTIRDEILAARRPGNSGNQTLTENQQEIARELLELGCIRFGEFQLKSGTKSPFYIDLRKIIHKPDFLIKIAAAYQEILANLNFQHVAGLPYAALPIATAVSILTGKSMIYPRKESKGYGTDQPVEGVYQAGEMAVVIDDLITTGGSKVEAIQKLEQKGLAVQDVVVLIDRSRKAGEELAERGLTLHSFLSISAIFDYYRVEKLVDDTLLDQAVVFVEGDEEK
jgi:uridine monophosphate synthetase